MVNSHNGLQAFRGLVRWYREDLDLNIKAHILLRAYFIYEKCHMKYQIQMRRLVSGYMIGYIFFSQKCELSFVHLV